MEQSNSTRSIARQMVRDQYSVTGPWNTHAESERFIVSRGSATVFRCASRSQATGWITRQVNAWTRGMS